MRKILYLFLNIAMALMSCSKSFEEKAHESVRTYLIKNIDDPSSYESVEFGKMDSVKGLNREEREKYIKAVEERKDNRYIIEVEKLISSGEIHHNKILYEQKKNELRKEDSIRRKAFWDSLSIKYPMKFIGYNITHKFRAKNKVGALELQEYKFFLDTNFVVERGEIEKKE